MILTNEQIKNCANGVVRIEENDKGIEFHRFTRTQESFFYKTHSLYCNEYFFNGYFGKISRTSGGVTFDFLTDAKSVKINFGKIEYPCDAKIGLFDVFVDGVFYKSFNADKSFEFECNCGTHSYSVYFPVYNFPIISSIELINATEFVSIKKQSEILFLGDSITHGGNATHPSNTYVMRLARELNVGVINQGMSGFVYDKNAVEKVCEPKIVVTAYGINDYFRKSTKILKSTTTEFIKKVRSTYSNSKIVSILPLWTAWNEQDSNFAIEKRSVLEKVYAKFSDFVIDGFELVPHDVSLLEDKILHPNDKGFECYSENLVKYIKFLL